MRKIGLFLIVQIFLTSFIFAQEKFDIVSFKTPKGWTKEIKPNAVLFTIKDEKDGSFAAMTLFKSLPAGMDSRKNFDLSWESIVNESMGKPEKAEMSGTDKDNGWTIETGTAASEHEGMKAAIMMVSASGGGKVVNLLILINSNKFQSSIKEFILSLVLPKIAAGNSSPNQTNQPSAKFRFTTTNFDEGWTAFEEKDWVRATKGNTFVRIHYPNPKTDIYNSDKIARLQNAWNVLISPRYSNISNFVIDPTSGIEYIDFAEADAVEKSSGKRVHVTLVKKHYQKGTGRYLEFVTNGKTDFDREFGTNRDRDYGVSGWDKIVNTQFMNRFAVAATDLTGKWTTSDYASLSYYFVSSGEFAGATATSTADEFNFFAAGTYQSEHTGASGMVGNLKFSRQIYQGKFTADDWTLTLTNRFQGGSENYKYYFEAVKGGRILMMTDRNNTIHSLVKH